MHSELYLGVNADDDGNRTYGIGYSSLPYRPSFLVLNVYQIKVMDESLVKIQLFHDDVIIGESSFQTGAKSSYEQYTLSINYASDPDKMKLVPNKLLVLFKSGTKEALSIEDDLKNFNSGTTDKTADATFRGNELFIDDVELIYDK